MSQLQYRNEIKTLFLISYFNLSKKRNGTLGTRINQSTYTTENMTLFKITKTLTVQQR